MNLEEAHDALEAGDKLDITFRSVTRHSGAKATRKLRSIDLYGRPIVAYHGWDNFVVRPNEVISIEFAE